VSAISREDDGRLALLTIDQPDAAVNTLTRAVGEELLEQLARIQTDAAVDAVVLLSGKPDVFIAGADIRELASLASPAEGTRLSTDAQRMMDDVAASRKPVVAAIHGTCLGGGLELALAAHYRVASSAPATTLGLPEVQLGIIPAAGGTQRLPRLVGIRRALDLILTGRPLQADRARRAGLVDDVVAPSILRRVAYEAAVRLAEGWQPARRSPRGPLAFLIDRNPIGRRVACHQAERRVRARTAGHYPAPLAAIEAVRHGLTRGMTSGLQREAALFGELVVGDVSRHLVQIFFSTTALKKDTGVDLRADGVRAVERIGVVGAGFMGAAIAGVAALRAGLDVRLRDTDEARVARGVIAARRILDAARTRHRIDRHEHARRSALLSGAADFSGFARRDLVIEAVFEELDAKQAVIAAIEQVVSDRCVVASNTSTIPIGRLQASAGRPERVVGMHFFSPVEKMPLLEVIRGPATADWATAMAVTLGQRMGKTVILVSDAPGFWVNRILAPYLNEAGWVLEDGASIERVDRIMTRFGFPMGPFALLDDVGLDIAARASTVLHEAFGERLVPAPAVAALVREGRLGRKSGAGFYAYRRGQRRADHSVARRLGARGASPPPDAEIERRLVLSLVNEAARACAEGVVARPRDGDIGAIFGFGFPAFLGGPLRYIDDRGAASVVSDLERCAAAAGARFTPAGMLTDMATSGGRFYGDGP
jgi:3-hydroxyacyl-CoA dehydrogenase/enoyl-CoA hydratase/3-hydroxybutyryl-CoA epimerase